MLVNHANRYIEEKWCDNKSLMFDSTDEKKRVTKKIESCLEWNQRQIRRSKQCRIWLWKRLHEN